MTARDDLDRRLEDWMRSTASAPYAGGRRRGAIAAVADRRPLPRWRARLGSDWASPRGAATFVPERIGGRRWVAVFALLALLAAGLAGILVLGGALSPHPSTGRLVYGLDGDIWIAAPDGSHPVRIAKGTAAIGPGGPGVCGSLWGEGRIWSPDGRHLAYRGSTPQCDGIVSISDPDGGHRVTVPGNGWRIAWSPDGSRIATWVDLWRTIGVYRIDGTREALLDVSLVGLLPGDFDIAWAPDGRSLLVPCADVCELPLDGGIARPLPAGDPLAHGPAWGYAQVSPDGRRVAYVLRGMLVMADRDGSDARDLVETGAGDPVWSQAGDWIAASIGPDAGVVDLPSGRVTIVARGDASARWRPLAFSPGGDMVLLSRTVASGTGSLDAGSLWSVRPDGSDLRELVGDTAWGDWQPAGGG